MSDIRSTYTDECNFYGRHTPRELAETFGTPLYVYNENVLRQRCRDLMGLSKHPGFGVNYSVKANATPALLRIVREEGLVVDAMSPGELYMDELAGFTPAEILYISNNNSEAELKNAVSRGLLISVDSLSQLDTLGRINKGGKVMVRFNPGIGAGHHAKVITAGKDTKFGVTPDKLDEVFALLEKHDLTLAGINQHIGSLFMEPDGYLDAAEVLLHLADRLPASMLAKLEVIDFGGGFSAMSSGTFGKYENIGLGLLVLCVIVAFNCSKSPLLRMSGIAIGLLVGYAVALMLGMVDFSALENLPLITVPIPFKYGFSFDLHAFVLAGTIYLLSVLEAVGDITATAMVSHRQIQGHEFQKRLSGGVLADGLVSVIASALGSLPLTTFAQNNGVIQMTGVASRHVGKFIAVILVLLGLFPVVGRFFTTIPSPVMGGAMVIMFSMIAIAGGRIIISHGFDRRETLIVATSLGLGLGVSYDPNVFKVLPAGIYMLVENPICAGGITAIIMNLVLPQSRRRKAAANAAEAVELIQLSDKPDTRFATRPAPSATAREQGLATEEAQVRAPQVDRG